MSKILSMHLWVNLLLALCLGWATSCSNEENLSEEEILKRVLCGNWYYSVDNRIYIVKFYENGMGIMTTCVYSGEQWNEQLLSLQYTLSGNMLTLKPAEGDIWIGVVGVVGNGMSMACDDWAVMLSRYDGSERKIDELKKEVEDNWLDIEPTESVVQEGLLVQSGDVQAAVLTIYVKLGIYEYQQMLLEKVRLTGMDFQDCPAALITPSSTNVRDAWQAAYQVINVANMVINSIENIDMEAYMRHAYANEAKVLRCLVYYNLVQLWGNVPYVTTYNPDNLYEAMQSPALSAQDLYWELESILQSIDILPGGVGRVTEETVQALRGEMALSLGDKDKARYLLSNCQSDFGVAIDGQTNPGIYQVFGGSISNYTSEKIELLLRETDIEGTEDALALLDEWKQKKQYWGYWGMLIRTGQAQAVYGCEEYELLMPIPQNELEMMPSLVQNPGY